MCVSVFGKRLSRKSNNVVVFPFAFHIVVQQPFKPLRSRLLLYDLEPSQASFALRFKSLLMTLLPALITPLPASEEFLSKFPSSRYLSSFGFYPLDLSGVGDPAGSNATAGLVFRVTGTHKPLHHDKVEISSGGPISLSRDNINHKYRSTITFSEKGNFALFTNFIIRFRYQIFHQPIAQTK
jgi:hypothetical protein